MHALHAIACHRARRYLHAVRLLRSVDRKDDAKQGGILLVDGEFQILGKLDGHGSGLVLALQDVSGHVARLHAELVVVDAVGGKAACLYHVFLSADDRLLGGICDGDEGGHGGCDDIVRRLIECVHVVHEALCCLLQVVHGGNRGDFDREPLGLRVLGHLLDLYLGVDFAGAVDGADGLGIRAELDQKIDLLVDGVHVAGACDIPAGLLVRGDELCALIVGNGCADDGDILCCIGDGLRRRRCDGADEIQLRAHEALGDVLQVGLICLCVLAIEFDILALFKAAFLEPVHEAFVGRVQRIVLHKLHNAYLVGLGAGAACGLVCPAARKQAGRQERCGAEDQRPEFLGYMHEIPHLFDCEIKTFPIILCSAGKIQFFLIWVGFLRGSGYLAENVVKSSNSVF